MDIVPSAQFPSLNNITPAKLVSSLIIVVLVVAAIVLLIVLLIGGITVITSGGNDPQKASKGSQAVTGAFIGLVIVFGAWAILNLLSKFFGINLFQLNIPSMTSP